MGRLPPSAIRIDGEIAYVTLTHGFEAIIDAQDLPLISGHYWSANIGPRGHAYAFSTIKSGTVMMHRLIMRAEKGQMVDHVDGDGLNNRRSNLRFCNMTQNMANKAVERRNRLGIKGVSESYGKFKANITPDGKTIYLGTYKTAEEAAAAYKGAAKVLWGDFAKK